MRHRAATPSRPPRAVSRTVVRLVFTTVACSALLVACSLVIPARTPSPVPSTAGHDASSGPASPTSPGLSPQPGDSGQPSLTASPRPTPTPVAQPAGPGQIQTSWGPAWDGLPSWFPRPDGARPTETGGEPASAELDVPLPGGTVGQVVDFYRIALEVGNYAYAVDGPLEDGSFVVDASDRLACRFRVVVAPLGDHALVRFFSGLGCRR